MILSLLSFDRGNTQRPRSSEKKKSCLCVAVLVCVCVYGLILQIWVGKGFTYAYFMRIVFRMCTCL